MATKVSEIISQQLDDIKAIAAYKESNEYIGAIQQLPAHLAESAIYANLAGLVGDGVTDVTIAFQSILDLAEKRKIVLGKNKVYKLTSKLQMPVGCEIEGNGSTLEFHLSGQVEGLIVNDYCQISNLKSIVKVVVATNSIGQHQCPIVIGDYPTGVGAHDVILKNITVDTERDNGNGIAITGSCYNIKLKNITVPDSATMGRPILIHWGGFTAPELGTTHPHNISISNVKCGRITKVAEDAAIIYVSGAYNIDVTNVKVKEAYQVVYVKPGDQGYIYSGEPDRNIDNVKFKNIVCEKTNYVGFTVWGKAPLISSGAVIYETPVVFENCYTYGSNGVDVSWGFLTLESRRASFINCIATKHALGFYVSSDSVKTRIIGGKFYLNKRMGISITGGDIKSSDTHVEDVTCHSNGTDTAINGEKSGIFTGRTIRPNIIGCSFGQVGEQYQLFGVRVEIDTNHGKLKDNHCYGITSGGIAYSLGNSTTPNVVEECANNTAETGITLFSGQKLIPLGLMGGKTLYSGSGIPTAGTGTYQQGDIIFSTNPGSTLCAGWICTVAGDPGTWKPFGTITA